MNIVNPYAKIIYPKMYRLFSETKGGILLPDNLKGGIELLQRVEEYGRVSHRSEDRQTSDSWKPFISAVVLQHGDWSITEHVSVTVEALVDRGITHEWVRHRLGAYTQESTRFVNYSKPGHEAQFIKPLGVNATETFWQGAIEHAEASYQAMIHEHIPPQLARSVFPNALASKLIVTYNLRNWRHFFLMRTSKESHPQMRQVTIPLLKEFQETIPLLYDDIIPESRQIENMRMPR